MEADRALEGLSQRTERILSILAEGRKALAVPEASEWKALALRRWEMLRALDEFIRFKKRHILEPVSDHEDAAVADRAVAIALDNDALREGYEDFVRYWAFNNPIAADAPYRAAALEMTKRIERQVIGDIQEIEALLRDAAALTDETPAPDA